MNLYVVMLNIFDADLDCLFETSFRGNDSYNKQKKKKFQKT